jgi:hypothetical protein
MLTVLHSGTAKAKAQDGKPEAESKAPAQKAAPTRPQRNHQQNLQQKHTAKANHGKCKYAHREARAKVARNGGPYEIVAQSISLA